MSEAPWYDREDIETYAKDWESQRSAAFIKLIQPGGTRWYKRLFLPGGGPKSKTMLHQETLTLLDYFAGRARHGILEIGPYTGYSTIVMARALGRDIPLVTVEVGGAQDHPELPSADIIADLRRNLAREGVADKVAVVEGHSNDERVKAEVRRLFSPDRKIDLLVIDADGEVGRDITAFKDLLAAGAVILCDDYDLPSSRDHDGGADLKRAPTSAWLDGAVQSGLLREIGVFKWATWVGQYTGP